MQAVVIVARSSSPQEQTGRSARLKQRLAYKYGSLMNFLPVDMDRTRAYQEHMKHDCRLNFTQVTLSLGRADTSRGYHTLQSQNQS